MSSRHAVVNFGSQYYFLVAKMNDLMVRISSALKFIPVYLQVTILLAVTGFFVFKLGKAFGKAFFYMTH